MFNWWKLSFCVAPYLIFTIEWMLIRAALRGYAKHRPSQLSRQRTVGGFPASSFQSAGDHCIKTETKSKISMTKQRLEFRRELIPNGKVCYEIND